MPGQGGGVAVGVRQGVPAALQVAGDALLDGLPVGLGFGPGAAQALAGFGADVLRIDPPSWNEAGVVPEVTLGKRSARLNLHDKTDRLLALFPAKVLLSTSIVP